MENYYSLTMDSLRTYILGGSSEFILSEKDTKNHIGFHVKRDSKNKNLYWVRYKAIDWIYIGRMEVDEKLMEQDEKYCIKFFPVTSGIEDTLNKANLFRKFFMFVYYLLKIPSNLEVLYTGQCSICHRTLKNPTYIKIGIGPECLKKL